MKRHINSLLHIFHWNTLIVTSIAVVATYICIENNWEMDFPMTIIGIAVVFPIVFSISGAYKRRETALTYYAQIKGLARTVYFSSRDWLRDKDKKSKMNQEEFKKDLHSILLKIREFFQTESKEKETKKEQEVYKLFSKFSQTIEGLRDRGMPSGEVSRVNSHFTKMVVSFESFKHIFQYRTPRTLRTYSKIFIYLIPIVYAPYFAHIADGRELGFAFIMPILFALIFTSLDNIQGHLENPFDQVGEDDIKINAEKFVESLEL